MAETAAVSSDFSSVDRRWVVGAGTLGFGLVLIRTAWVCDDAYITFRTVANFLQGYGLRWNVANRVQAYTHPLWMFVMSGAAAITGDVYFTSIFLSIALSLVAVGIVTARLASSIPMAVLAVSALAVSKSFVEYSTSGLENSLTHLLLVGLFVTIARQQVRRPPTRLWRFGADTTYAFVLSLVTALLLLNRLDLAVLVSPIVLAELWRIRPPRPWLAVAMGLLPIVLWEVFSALYYGFLVPNTAYAKLGPGVPRLELIQQGLLYLLDSISNDPVTLMIILAAAASPFILRTDWAVPLGIVVHVAFVVWAGGDFMSGRFLAAPYLCAVVHLVRQPLAPRFTLGWGAALGLVWLMGLGVPRPTILSTASFGDVKADEAVPPSHVTDERRYYYRYSGLLSAHRGVPMPDHRWFHLGEEALEYHIKVEVVDAAGFLGYAAGPEVHIVDRWGLGDPLLARLPAEVPWQIGHFTRIVPIGYQATLSSGRNTILDTAVGEYYEKLHIITEDPIWSRRRFRTILAMNLGRYQSLIESYGLVRTSFVDVSTERTTGIAWDAPGNLIMRSRGVLIAGDQVNEGGRIELSVSNNDTYRVRVLRDDSQVAEQLIFPGPGDPTGLQVYTLALPSNLPWNAISIVPVDGDSRYSLGHLRLLP